MVAPAVLVALLAATPAHAVLGGAPGAQATGAPPAPRTGAMRVRPLASGVQVHEVATADGGTIREYATASGVVFAVSWQTRFKPRLEGLFGRYHADYAAAAGEAARRPGVQRQSLLRGPDLVVRSSVHLNAFSGYAVVPSLVPAGFGAGPAR